MKKHLQAGTFYDHKNIITIILIAASRWWTTFFLCIQRKQTLFVNVSDWKKIVKYPGMNYTLCYMNVQKQHVWNKEDVCRWEKYKSFPHRTEANALIRLH